VKITHVQLSLLDCAFYDIADNAAEARGLRQVCVFMMQSLAPKVLAAS
jgi:hypothetical protein